MVTGIKLAVSVSILLVDGQNRRAPHANESSRQMPSAGVLVVTGTKLAVSVSILPVESVAGHCLSYGTTVLEGS